MLLILAVLVVKGQHALALISKPIDTVQTNLNLIVGKALPAFTLRGADGRPVKSSAIKGRVVLIDFWASWCVPCRAAIPHLKDLYSQYHQSGFEILSVSIDQNSKAWKNAMLKEAMPWLQAIDKYEAGQDASVMMNLLGIQSVPFAILLYNEGKVILINPEARSIDDYLRNTFNK